MPLLVRPAAHASLVVDLARIVGAQHVSSLDAERLAYARDCWPRDIMRLRAGEVPAAPACVVWPGTPEEVARLLQYAEQVQIPVVPYGAGSGVSGGARPSAGGIVLDMKRMRAVRSLDPESLRLEVEAGVIGERLERWLAARGYTLGHFPSSIVCSTVGGWLAARSAGQMSTLYGKIEDMAFGLEVATPGKIRRLMLGPRPPDGPDWNALMIGSEGTFGAITAAELRIRRQPEARLMLGFQFPKIEAGMEAVRKILRAGLRPAVVRLYDALDTLMGRGHGKEDEDHDEVRSYDQLAARMETWFQDLSRRVPGGVSAAERIKQTLLKTTVRAVLGSPLVLNRALEALPEDSLLILGFEGQRALAAAELVEAQTICRAEQGIDLGPGPGEHWLANRYNVSFKQSKLYAAGLFADTMEVAATWDRLGPLYRAVRRAVQKDAVVLAHFSHAYGEGCSIYFSFAGLAGDPRNPAEALERYDRIWRNAIIATHEAGGTLSHHHGVGESKVQGMAREHGPGGMRLLGALKDAFDPTGIMNPGKLGLEVGARRLRRTVSVAAAPDGFPAEIAAAVGERNIETLGGRTVVRPPDESALAAVLRVAHARGIFLSTDQTGYRAPANAVRLDLKRMEGVSRISEHSLFVEAEAGVRVEQLERLLVTHGLTMGHLHPRTEGRTLGAALSRNLLVRRGPALGDLKDLGFAVRGLLPTGQPLETRPVPRSATGPELDRAFIGGHGRLGIITKATLRVGLLPKASRQLAYRFPSLASGIEAAKQLLHRGIKPAAARVVPGGDGAAFAVELWAPTEAILRAQQAILEGLVSLGGGVAIEADGLALQGRFDAVVEVAALWQKAAETLHATRQAAAGEAWLDFLAPEAVTVVVRVVDAESRKAAVQAAISAGGRVLAGTRSPVEGDPESFQASLTWRDFVTDQKSLGPYADILEAVAANLDPSSVFKER